MSPTIASTLDWRKSSRCESALCLEVAMTPGLAAVRNSADPGLHLAFAAPEWRAFLADVRSGRLARG